MIEHYGGLLPKNILIQKTLAECLLCTANRWDNFSCGQNLGVSVMNCQIHQGFVPYGIQCVPLHTSLNDYSPKRK